MENWIYCVRVFIYHEVPNTYFYSSSDVKPLKSLPQLSHIAKNSGFFHFSVATQQQHQQSLFVPRNYISIT